MSRRVYLEDHLKGMDHRCARPIARCGRVHRWAHRALWSSPLMGPSQALSRGYRWAHKPGLVARTHRYRVQTPRVRYRGLTYTNSEDCCKIWTVCAPARYRSIAKSIDGPIIGAFPWLSAGPSQALFRGCRWAHIHGLPVHTRRSASSKRCAHSGFGNNATGVPSLRFIYRNG